MLQQYHPTFRVFGLDSNYSLTRLFLYAIESHHGLIAINKKNHDISYRGRAHKEGNFLDGIALPALRLYKINLNPRIQD
ncbi:MAG: hypothetical protein RQ982_07975 [Gammaproteobacteria bacterium]|nr:hypothetical protein [Gammaproteobacteria bacterium]